VVVTLRDGDLGDEIGAGGPGLGLGLGAQRGHIRVAERAGKGTVVAQVACQAAGVDASDGGDTVASQVGVEVLGGPPVAPPPGHLAEDHAPAEGTAGLVVDGGGAVVAQVRGGEGDDLPGVGRVADDLLVAGHRRVEDDLTADDAAVGVGAEELTLERLAVGEDQGTFPNGHRSTPG